MFGRDLAKIKGAVWLLDEGSPHSWKVYEHEAERQSNNVASKHQLWTRLSPDTGTRRRTH